MSVVDIHPEELLDKRAAGALSESEASLLDAHLARCEACRFELSLREDLEEDLAQRRLSLPPQLLSQMPQVEPVRMAPSRIRRWSVAWIAAAAVSAVAAGAFGSYAAPRVWPWVQQRFEGQRVSAPLEASTLVSAKPNRARPASNAAPVAEVAAAAPLAPSASSSACPEPSSEAVASAKSRPSAPPTRNVGTVRAARAESPSANAASESAASSDDDSAQSLFSAANRARRSGDVTRAGELYRSLQQKFPRSPEASLSRVTLATLLLNSDPASALASFDAYLASGGPLAAEALVGRARALRALGRAAESRRAWQEVATRYPTSVYATEAREVAGTPNAP